MAGLLTVNLLGMQYSGRGSTIKPEVLRNSTPVTAFGTPAVVKIHGQEPRKLGSTAESLFPNAVLGTTLVVS